MKNKILLLIALATLGLTATAMAQVPSYVPTNGLVGFWPFNGNANDESGNGNNGTVNGATLTSDRNGYTNSAYSFDAFNWSWGSGGDYVYIPYNPNLNTIHITVSVWFLKSANYISNQGFPSVVKRFEGGYSNPNGQSWGVLANKNDSLINTFILPPNTSNNYTTYLSQTGPVISSNQWHNVIFSFDGISMLTYYDGQLVTTIPANGIIMNTNGNSGISVGMSIQANGHWDPFNGLIDDIGIWNRALSQQEITDFYNGCQLSVNIQPANQTININNNVQFIVGSSDTNATYQWQTNLGVGFQNLNNAGQYSGTAKDTLMISNVSMSNNNQQFRCIINNGSCTDTSNVAVLSVNNNVGINELAQKNLFSVFPNPAKNTMHVKAYHKLIGSVFTIYDNMGKVVKSGKLNAANTTIDLSNLSGGIYLFSVGENRKQTFKIIKE